MTARKPKPPPPNPGSPAAVEDGCLCPVADNGAGEGSGRFGKDGKPLFWITYGCPLHGNREVGE